VRYVIGHNSFDYTTPNANIATIRLKSRDKILIHPNCAPLSTVYHWHHTERIGVFPMLRTIIIGFWLHGVTILG
jgi:hypothetical protein